MTPNPQRSLALALLMTAACSEPAPAPDNAAAPADQTAPEPANESQPTTSNATAASAPAAAEPEQARPALAFDATEAAAVQLVDRYHRLIARRDYAPAWNLWSDGGKASGMSEPAFAESFAKYASWNAEIGTPGRAEGAAGSVYIEIPVTVTGALVGGAPFRLEGPMTLRRVNDVPGSTPEQRRWHIAASGLKPRPERD